MVIFLPGFQNGRGEHRLIGSVGEELGFQAESVVGPIVRAALSATPLGYKVGCVEMDTGNAGHIDTVGILTQYQPLELNEYIGNGQPWGLKKGTANAIYQNIDFIDRYDPREGVAVVKPTAINSPLDWHAICLGCFFESTTPPTKAGGE